MQQNQTPRYEFRVFEHDLSDAARRLADSAIAHSDQSTTHTYLVSRLNIDTNVKFRVEAIDVKVLEAREGLFELWRPVLHSHLPVDLQTFAERVAPRLGVDLDLPRRGEMGAAEIVTLVSRIPALEPVKVEKRRRKFDHGDGLSEFVEIHIDGARIQSVAVEAESVELASGLLERAGIGMLANESYPAFLQRITFG